MKRPRYNPPMAAYFALHRGAAKRRMRDAERKLGQPQTVTNETPPEEVGKEATASPTISQDR